MQEAIVRAASAKKAQYKALAEKVLFLLIFNLNIIFLYLKSILSEDQI